MYALPATLKELSTKNLLTASIATAVIRTHLAMTWLAFWLKPKTLVSSRRRLMLRSLRKYWISGSFPVNDGHLSYTPVFRDSRGTLCAMGYLADSDNQNALVNKIVANNNFINLSTAYDTQFDAWIQTTGLSYKEAAHIQPGYPWQEPYIQNSDKLLGEQERILVALVLIPLYICLIGAYMIIGKRILTPGSVSRIVFVASATIAIIAAAASLLFLAVSE